MYNSRYYTGTFKILIPFMQGFRNRIGGVQKLIPNIFRINGI
jgi:hypothetical protein